MINQLAQWVNVVSGEGWQWYVKFLSGNDTLLNGSHQAGPYFPKDVLFALFPSVHDPLAVNPRANFPALIDSHAVTAEPHAIWYNNGLRGQTRNECRITSWGGKSSPLLDPEATGSLCVFAFHQRPNHDAEICRVWLCTTPAEEDYLLDLIGPVEPGVGRVYHAGAERLEPADSIAHDSPCHLNPDEIPREWLLNFPDAATIVAFAISRLVTANTQSPDRRLLRRRDCEFEVFRSIEEVIVLPRLKEGFATVDIFVDFANAVTNRRKSRSGASLELHARTIFDEEKLSYSHDEESEGGKRPDFLFPSAAAYRDLAYPADRLRMLGVKTTCKDRWRQVLEEADRVGQKHLLTLQQGVSQTQFAQMTAAGIQLVVPSALHASYRDDIQPHIISLERFISETRANCT